jgi:hypothetical protein
MIARILVSLFAAIFISLGVWVAYGGVQWALEASQSAGWPTATGQIVASHVRVSVSHGRHGGTSYTPVISYTYQVDGTSFTGTVVAPGRNWGSKSAYAAVALYPSGRQAQVHYSPGDPAKATLEAGLHGYNFGQFLLGLMLIWFGLLAVLLVTNTVRTPGSRSSRLRTDTLGGRLVLPLVGVFAVNLVALIWLS